MILILWLHAEKYTLNTLSSLLISRVGRHNVWKSTNKVSITLIDSNANVSNVDLYSVKSDFFWWFLNTSWAALLAKALKKSISLQKKKWLLLQFYSWHIENAYKWLFNQAMLDLQTFWSSEAWVLLEWPWKSREPFADAILSVREGESKAGN